MISCVILTLNEEKNIAPCINSIPWKSDIHVVDSLSTDGTAAIAAQSGAKVWPHAFVDYAAQRNFGLSLDFSHEWVLMIDADERVTPELAEEIECVLTNAADDLTMLLVRRKDIFLGRWLRRSSGYPTWFARLMRRGRVKVIREINEQYVTDGRAERLKGHLLHFPFNKGVDWWYERHNRYSTMESITLAQEREQHHFDLSGLITGDSLRRRASFKQLAYRLPFRPFLIFFYLYFIRGGFLDGDPGYCFAQMRMSYEIMIDAKTRELRAGKKQYSAAGLLEGKSRE